jgi:hypothetical protein
MSELTLKLIIILIPGAISTIIYGKLILHKDWSSFKFVLYSILFGTFSYFILQLIINISNQCLCFEIPDLSLWESITDSSNIPYLEVLFSSFISIITPFFVAYIQNRKVINYIGQRLGISNKYGEENLFSMFLNEKEVEWIYLRDIKNNLTYHGWVKSFSESETISEIRLCDVTVYEYKSSDELYEVKEIYLSLNKHEIKIELANIIDSEKN